MLGFIKKKVFIQIILSISLLSIVGCTGNSTGQEYMEETIVVNTFAYDEDTKSLHISLIKPSNKTTKIYTLEDGTDIWVADDPNLKIIDTSSIIYVDNKVIVKDNKKNVIFEDTLPTLAEITENIDIPADNYTVKYTPFKVGENFSWDRKTHIISVGVDKYSKGCNVEQCFKSMYYLSATHDTSHWNINLIYKLEDDFVNDGDMLQVKKNVFRRSTDANGSFCFRQSNVIKEDLELYCLVKNDDIKKIHIKTFEFETIPKSWVIRHNDNYHIFRDLESNDKDRGKYLLYEKYTKENLTTPVNQQKIYWEKNNA